MANSLTIDIPVKPKDAPLPIPVSSEAVDIPVPQITGEIGPIEGFWNNLRLPYSSWQQFLHGSPRGAIEDNLIINLVRNVTGNTTEAELRKKHGDAYVDAMLIREEDRRSSISLSDMKDAFNADPGAFTAEFVNGIIADPELIVTPLGWRAAAAKTAAALKSSGTVARTAAANLAGAGGAATTAASIIAPISIAEQLDKTGKINWSRTGEETLMAAGIAVLLGGVGAKKFPSEKAIELAQSTVGSAQVRAVARTPIADAVNQAIDGMRGTDPYILGRFFLDRTGAKSITILDDATKYSPTFKALRETIEYKEFSNVANPLSHYERVSMATGEFVTRLQQAFDKTRTPFFGVITKEANDTIVKALRGGKQTVVSRELRQILNDVRQFAIDAGLEVGEIKNYFPRVYNTKALKNNEDAFIKVLTDHNVDAGDAYSIFKRIVENDGILDDTRKLDRIDIYGRKSARAKNVEMPRVLKDIPDEKLAPFLENSAYPTLHKYVLNVTKRAEFARSFGKGGGKLNHQLKTAMEEMRAAGRPMRKYELNRVYDIVDAIQGMYRPHEVPAFAKASKILGTYQLIRTLPLAVLSSITEPLIVLTRGRTSSAIKAIPALLEHTAKSWVRILYKKYPKPEVTLAAERVGAALDDSIGELLTQTFGGEANRVTAAFFKMTLLSQWTRMNRILGYHAGRHMIIDNLKDIKAGKRFRFERKHQELRELGVPVKEGVAWIERGMPNDEFAKIIEGGALRFTNEVVMNPRVTNRPLWHSNPNLHLIAQLKGFPTTFGNTVIKRWIREIVDDPLVQFPKHAATGMVMTMIAMLVNDMRDELKGVERNETEYQRIIRGSDRTGLTGIGQMALDSMYAHRFGRSGLAQILGPMASQIDAWAAAMGDLVASAGGDPGLELDPLREEVASAIPIVSQKRSWRKKVEELLGAEE